MNGLVCASCHKLASRIALAVFRYPPPDLSAACRNTTRVAAIVSPFWSCLCLSESCLLISSLRAALVNISLLSRLNPYVRRSSWTLCRILSASVSSFRRVVFAVTFSVRLDVQFSF